MRDIKYLKDQLVNHTCIINVLITRYKCIFKSYKPITLMWTTILLLFMLIVFDWQRTRVLLPSPDPGSSRWLSHTPHQPGPSCKPYRTGSESTGHHRIGQSEPAHVWRWCRTPLSCRCVEFQKWCQMAKLLNLWCNSTFLKISFVFLN